MTDHLGAPPRDPIPVEAIQTIKDHISRPYLSHRRKEENTTSIRDTALFTIGLNTGLRASDLVRLRLGDFVTPSGNFRQSLRIRQRKTKGIVSTPINGAIKEAIAQWQEDNEEHLARWGGELQEAHLFYTTCRGHGRDYTRHLSPNHTSLLVKKWCNEVGLDGNFGTHSMRKTRGMSIFKAAANEMNAAQALLITARTLGHSELKSTMQYLGLSQAEAEKWQNKVEL
jgi:integrase